MFGGWMDGWMDAVMDVVTDVVKVVMIVEESPDFVVPSHPSSGAVVCKALVLVPQLPTSGAARRLNDKEA
jgi:hypothetical protein